MEYKYFEITSEIEQAIVDNDKEALKVIMAGIINRDPTFATTRFEETNDYLSKRGVNLYEAKKTLKNEYTIDEPDMSYYRMLLVWLLDNFCEERIDEIKILGKKLYDKEYTWGKDEAKNFLNPDTKIVIQKKNSGAIVFGGIIIALVVIVLGILKMNGVW